MIYLELLFIKIKAACPLLPGGFFRRAIRPVILKCPFFSGAPYANRRIRRDAYYGNLMGRPFGGDATGTGKAPVAGFLVCCNILPYVYQIAHRHTLERPACHFLEHSFRIRILVKLNLRIPAAALYPCPDDFPDHLVPVMVIKDAADGIQAA